MSTLEHLLLVIVMIFWAVTMYLMFAKDKDIIVSKESNLFVKDLMTGHFVKIDIENDIKNDNGNVTIELKR